MILKQKSPSEEVVDKKYNIAHNVNDPDRLRSGDVTIDKNITFDTFFLSHQSKTGLSRCGFRSPSPIQLLAIPLGICGFDLIVQSKAGTGKTCIFTLIALEALQFNPSGCVQTIVIAPTREVAIQIHEVLDLIGSYHVDLRCCLCIGGVDVKHDRVALSGKSCQIIVGTPGRIKQLIELNILKTQNVELFVLDEADKLMDEQFKIQVDEIYKRLPSDKQMIVTSATYPNELSIFLQQYMKTPKIIRLGKDLSLEAIKEYYIRSKAGHSSKKNLENKLVVLKSVLDNLSCAKCFIFTNFQARAPIICNDLNKDELFKEKHGRAGYICAELPQSDRIKIFKDFKTSNENKLLISTDVSARGIDIQDIDLVINFDLPIDRTTYYHRIGRAGRFGQPGKAVSIVTGDALDQAMFEKNILSDKIEQLNF